jgi:hypothetical protein
MTKHYQQRNYLLSIGLQLFVCYLRSVTVLSVMWHTHTHIYIYIYIYIFIYNNVTISVPIKPAEPHMYYTYSALFLQCNTRMYLLLWFLAARVLPLLFCASFTSSLPASHRHTSGHHHGVNHRGAWSSPEPVIRSASCHKFTPRFDAAHCTLPPDAIMCLSYACRFTDVSFLQPSTETAYQKIQTSRAITRYTRIGPHIHSHWCSKSVKIATMKIFIFLFVYNQVAQ